MRQYQRPAGRYHIAAVLAVLLGLSSFGFLEAEAQQAASFEQLLLLVTAGDTVSVTESTGQISKGKIAGLSRSSLRLVVDGIARDMAEMAVSEIKQRRADSLGNGARNGAIAGAAFGVFGAFFSDCRGSCAGDRAAMIGVMSALGAGIGVGVDALIIRTQVIYRGPSRPSSTHFNTAPLIRSRNKGVVLSVSF